MSEDWRQKAVSLFPELQDDLLGEDGLSIHEFFAELLDRSENAHVTSSTANLKRIYGFAEWCLWHEDEDVWNPAGTGFYEHLVDEPITRRQIPRWLSPEVFAEVSHLLEWRLGTNEFDRLRDEYLRQQKRCDDLSDNKTINMETKT